MAYEVRLTDDASRDLCELVHHIAAGDGAIQAGHVLDRIEEAFSSPRDTPGRGAYPKELLALGIREYREVFFKPYRIVYAVRGNDVTILLIADGRRDLQTLLQRRLLLA